MIVTIRNELTYNGVSKDFANQSEKKIKRSLKDMTGADDVEIIEVNSWYEDEEEDENKDDEFEW